MSGREGQGLKPFNSTRYIRNAARRLCGHHTLSPFNSTRYIRNSFCTFLTSRKFTLSTPHGTLGTLEHTEKAQIKHGHAFNSTRYIRNPYDPITFYLYQDTFNSTRYIRNTNIYRIKPYSAVNFQLHTVHQEPQTTTLTKIRHINPFVKGAPLSNEVNFPKSEIMQS